jgi:hypothetical protein
MPTHTVDSAARTALKDLTGSSFVPSTWFGGEYIGGCNGEVKTNDCMQLV